ncbi:S-layer homology domain-containing protein [bacterium]|nr:S-layer homology domain-containing protein [bacterium]
MSKSIRLVCGSLLLLLTGCSSTVDKEREDLKRELSEAKSETSSLKSELASLQNMAPPLKSTGAKDSGATTSSGAISNESSNTSSDKSDSASNGTTESSSTIALSDIADIPNKEMIDDLSKLHVFDDLAAASSSDKKALFKPLQPTTRGEYVTWLYRAFNAIKTPDKQLHLAPQAAQQFKDTPPSHPAYKYIQAISNAGYSIGYKDGTFRPDKPLTREEMLGIKVGLDVGKDIPPYRSQMEAVWKYSDGKSVDERFTGFIEQDYYVSGPFGSNTQRAFGKIGTFKPKQAVLRYEAAGTLWQQGQFGNNGDITGADALKRVNNK